MRMKFVKLCHIDSMDRKPRVLSQRTGSSSCAWSALSLRRAEMSIWSQPLTRLVRFSYISCLCGIVFACLFVFVFVLLFWFFVCLIVCLFFSHRMKKVSRNQLSFCWFCHRLLSAAWKKGQQDSVTSLFFLSHIVFSGTVTWMAGFSICLFCHMLFSATLLGGWSSSVSSVLGSLSCMVQCHGFDPPLSLW